MPSVLSTMWKSQLIALSISFLQTSANAYYMYNYLAVSPTSQSCGVVSDCVNAKFSQCLNGFCAHKNVFPANGSEIAGVIILPILLGFANNGGVGGGGLIIPVCIALFGFTTIQAIALSNFVIFAGAFVRYFGFSIF